MEPKSPPRSAGEVCRPLTLSRAARKLLKPGGLPGEFLRALLQHGLYVDGIHVMGSALRPRRGVWWACMCVRHTLPEGDELERLALAAAARWVFLPFEERLRDLPPAIAAISGASPAKSVAQAALAVGPLPEGITWEPTSAKVARFVAGAVLLAAARSDDPGYLYRQFLLIGLDVDADRLLLPVAEHWTSNVLGVHA